MSYRGDDSAIPDRLRLDYAPTGRATCKGCGGAISQGEVRCGVKVRSAFHDGFDMHWHHARCGLRRGATGPDSFKGFQRLRWADQAALAESLGQPLDRSKPSVAHAKRVNDMIWQVYDMIAAVPKKNLREALEQNGRFITDKMNPFEIAYTIADLVVNGMLPPCPFCTCNALVGEGGQTRCSGFAAGTSSCSLCVVLEPVTGGQVASADMRDRVGRLQTVEEGVFQLTPPLVRALQGWSIPPDAPASALTGAGRAAPRGFAGDGSDSEDEPEPPAGFVLAGLTVSSIGSPNPNAAELQVLVESNGGQWVTGSIGDGSCLNLLVATPAELQKKKRPAKLAAALDKGVPVVSADFIVALTGLPPATEASGPRPAGGKSTGGKSTGGKSTAAGAAEHAPAWADAVDADSVGSLKVPQLKAELQSRNLSSAGNKPVLVERLRLAMQAEAATRSERAFEDSQRGGAAAGPPSDAAAPQPPLSKRARTEAGPQAVPAVRGAALRQRKHMGPYLLMPEAGTGPRLPSLAAAVEAKKAADKRKQASKKPPRKTLPRVALGSALATVEPGAHKPQGTEVFIDEYNLAWHCVLNAVDLSEGTNKYYRMQLLRTGSSYCIYKAWGRVGGGAGGKSTGSGGRGRAGKLNSDLVHEHGTDLEGAKQEFRTKFKELARTDFEWTEPPCQAPGGYAVALLPGQMSDAATGAASAPSAGGHSLAGSKLPEPVAKFISIIGDKKMMADTLEEMHFDLDKMPLGSISEVQIKHGYEALTKLADALQSPAADQAEQRHRLLTLTTHFYTIIPHKFDLDQVPPVIDSLPAIRDKLDMVEALLQVSESQRLSRKLGPEADSHPIDAMYASLGVELALAEKEEIEMVETYAANTHGATHSVKIKVKEVLRVHREEEARQFRADLDNRKLLWHGSRITNWTGILSQGLRIAPPEAPATGYMFGKGVYFADMSTKSANYCSATSAHPTAVLLLCDVALGQQYERLDAEYEAGETSVKKKKHSTWGVGRFAPDEAGTAQLEGGQVVVPMGKAKESNYLEKHLARLKKAEAGANPALLYNEYIVYDVRQIKMKYVVLCELEF